MKTLRLSIIAVFVIVIFASSNIVLATQGIFPVANNDETYKINTQAAWKDWSPVSNILVASVNGSLLEYAGNGTELGILYQNQNFSITNIRFNHDGTKIAFLNDYTSSYGRLDIYVLDLQNNHLSQLTHGAHVQDLAWTPENNIIYAENNPKMYIALKILKLDLKNNSTSVILDINSPQFGGFDVSPDGKKIVIASNYTACGTSEYGCNTHLFIYDLESKNKTFTDITKTNLNSTEAGPRWSYDGSFITYGYMNRSCGPINAITPDGRNGTTLIDPGYYGTCNELAVVNKDGSIIAYDRNLGTSDGGMFFTYTDRCANNSCQFPSVPEFPFAIPILLISITSLIVFTRMRK